MYEYGRINAVDGEYVDILGCPGGGPSPPSGPLCSGISRAPQGPLGLQLGSESKNMYFQCVSQDSESKTTIFLRCSSLGATKTLGFLMCLSLGAINH